jgi:SAM-dependent methyltransferase
MGAINGAASMSLKKTLLLLLLGKRRAEQMRVAKIKRSPDRVMLVEHYIPAFAAEAGRMLWVGCQEYTADYPARLEAGGGEAWTLEFDPAAAIWGREGRHRTGDLKVANQLFADLTFDTILCNGVLGFGVNSVSDQQTALAAMSKILRPGGRLLLGWNTDKIADPVAAGFTGVAFKPTTLGDLPSRQTFPTVTHVFDLLERK